MTFLHESVGVQFVTFYWQYKKTHRQVLLFTDNRQLVIAILQTKTEQHLQK